MRLLLDTHVLLWALAESEHLPPQVREWLVSPANDVMFSAANIWEIAIKAQIGRLPLSVTVEEKGAHHLFVASTGSAAQLDALKRSGGFARLLVLSLASIIPSRHMSTHSRHMLPQEALMARYVEFPTESGDTILIEMEEAETSGIRKAGISPEDLVERADKTFEQALSSLRVSAQAIVRTVSGLAQPPDEVEVTFGLKIAGEVNALAVAKAGGDATYTVKMTWKNRRTVEENQ